MFEFHVARRARDLYQFDQTLFTFNGNVIFADFHAARVFAQRMNEKRDLARYPEQAVQASQINAMGLIDEILHQLFETYRRQIQPGILNKALAHLKTELGEQAVADALRAFIQQFPPMAVYRREQEIDEYLKGRAGDLSHEEITLEEMLMLWLANLNPAFSPFRELFDDTDLEKHTAYMQIMEGLQNFFQEAPGFGPGGENVIALLRAPALASPYSLTGQLEYIRTHWAQYLGEAIFRLLSSLDFIAEENKAIFWGPGPVEALHFGDDALAEPEQYSPDLDWMPQVVLLAKNTYVWLDQLSKQYGRPITTLDQIPDEELDTIAARGITGLWLIGLWERSKASKRIKQMMGNPDAVASAYSLYDYVIAADLGGPDAMANLRQRAWRRGIRMASDMVPNHMAIDSRWVIEHPDWFLSLDYSPFPSYTFNGPDLCDDPRVGVYLEDHYYDRSDAAVVFKRVDNWTGDTRYIYHGNDGTSMPWNDTAQLNYLKAEVREAVIQTILHVARQFPIIRFDAAMTLAKKHIQRLWFPEPGSGGAIASRAEHGLTKAEFDAAMPTEFWRDVVDRVAAEAPDTLLLAEAFWLLEGYFVRTLGMHRVYNSAFMHMLRDENNDQYRQLIKNTLEFDPEILKRYVNFMSNPDEETAIAQFDKGDKYFGVCTLLATVPGLPMFGHGQFEGYAEKYGMEYRQAYWDEQPDPWLIERHMREIVPLLKRRHLFADVQHFLLFDFFTPAGVDENVIAYTNRVGQDRALIIYHNKWADTRGWLRTSAAYLDKTSGQLTQKTLADGLDLPKDPNAYTVFRDYAHDLEYIRNCQDIHQNGLYIELGAYQRHVFLDFREVHDSDGRYAQLHDYLQGRGVPNIDETLTELFLQPLHQTFQQLINADNLHWLIQNSALAHPPQPPSEEKKQRLHRFQTQIETLLHAILDFAGETPGQPRPAILSAPPQPAGDEHLLPTTPGSATPPSTLPRLIRRELELALSQAPWPPPATDAEPNDITAYTLFIWILTHRLGQIISNDYASLTRSWFDQWLLGKRITAALVAAVADADTAARIVALVKLLIAHQTLLTPDYLAQPHQPSTPHLILDTLLRDLDAQNFLHIHRYNGILYYNKEAFSALIDGLQATATLLHLLQDADPAPLQKLITALRTADAASGYQVERLLELLS